MYGREYVDRMVAIAEAEAEAMGKPRL